MMLAVPLALWSASCCCVVFISCCIKIDDWGHFRVSISIVASKVPTISSFYSGFHNVPCCDEAQPRQAKECLERGQGWEIQREGNGEPSAEASPAIGTTRGLVMVAGSPFTASFHKSISEDSVMWASRKQTRNIRHRIVDWSPFETSYLLNNKVKMNRFLIICLYCCWIELDMVQRFTLLLTRQIWRMSELLGGHQLHFFNWHPSYTQQYLQFLHLQVCKQKYI